MYTDHINNIHVEVTDRCNAECPVCPRSYSGGETFPYVRDKELDLAYFKLIGQEFLSKIKTWNFCGVKGDPASAQELFEILDYILYCNPDTRILIRTNGGARNEKFWIRVGELFFNKDCDVVWSVDGWEETNHIYRKNVKWNKLYNNIMAYINTGASSMWEFNMFGHNQVDLPKVTEFCNTHNISLTTRKPFGFEEAGGFTKTIAVYNKTGDGKTSEYAYSIKPHGVAESQIADVVYPSTVDKHEWTPGVYDMMRSSWLKTSGTTVQCQSTKEGTRSQEIYLDSNGMIFPCCYTAGKFHMGDFQINTMFRPYKRKLVVTEENSIYDVLNLDLFTKVMPDGMSGKLDDDAGYCITCATHCKF
jgi:MoaA/NifB/PqqE/SkfB family radical SAM enzyme